MTCWLTEPWVFQYPGVRQMAGLHVLLSTNSHWPVAGLQVSVVQPLLSSHGGTGVKTHWPLAGLHTSDVQPLLSSQTTGGCVQAAEPATTGSQMSVVHKLLSLQKTTGVLFGVFAPTPGVFSGVSCATPPV